MKINTNLQKIEEILTKGVEKIYPSPQALRKRLLSGKRIRVYCGYDPSTPTLHLGNAITIRKLAQFQALGHEVIMLIGDFTGMIGDPTDKMAARKKLSRGEVLSNSKNYKKLASKILKFSGPNPAKIKYNSRWNDKLPLVDLIELASHFTVQQMIVREMFQKRIKKEKPISLHEFLYPLIQAYDSVAMDIDLEVGGNDQTFNMLCGRDLMKSLKNKEKFVLTTKLLTDPAGKKMGKTEGNMISLDEKPEEMYGKVMSWPDELIIPGLELCTDKSLKKIKALSRELERKQIAPRQLKASLAREIVYIHHDKKGAKQAEKEFNRVFKKKELPEKIPTVSIKEKSINILELLVKTKLASSKSEAKRLVLQGGVKINKKPQKGWQEIIKLKKGMVVQVGKRKFVKII